MHARCDPLPVPCTASSCPSQPGSPYSHALRPPGRSARLEAADPHGSERPRPKARAPNALAAFRLRAHALARWLVVASPSHGHRPHLAASPPARALHDACAGFPLRGVACTAAEAAGWLATTPLFDDFQRRRPRCLVHASGFWNGSLARSLDPWLCTGGSIPEGRVPAWEICETATWLLPSHFPCLVVPTAVP
jgi:hypothetical protein